MSGDIWGRWGEGALQWEDVAEYAARLDEDEVARELWRCGIARQGGRDGLEACWRAHLEGLDLCGREEVRRLLRFLAFARGDDREKCAGLRRWVVGGRRVVTRGSEAGLGELAALVRNEVDKQVQLRAAYPTVAWALLRKEMERKELEAELAAAVSDDSESDEDAHFGETFKHEQGLRVVAAAAWETRGTRDVALLDAPAFGAPTAAPAAAVPAPRLRTQPTETFATMTVFAPSEA